MGTKISKNLPIEAIHNKLDRVVGREVDVNVEVANGFVKKISLTDQHGIECVEIVAAEYGNKLEVLELPSATRTFLVAAVDKRCVAYEVLSKLGIETCLVAAEEGARRDYVRKMERAFQGIDLAIIEDCVEVQLQAGVNPRGLAIEAFEKKHGLTAPEPRDDEMPF